MLLTRGHIIGMVSIVLGVTVLNFLLSRNSKSKGDFTLGGRKAGVSAIIGTILGTAIGGTATIATVQLSYEFGLSGICFSLGAGLGLIMLGLTFAKPLRESKVETGSQFLLRAFGKKAGLVSSFFVSIGIFINIVANALGAIGLLTSVSGLSAVVSAIIIGVLIISYVIFSGIEGASSLGKIKTVLIFSAMLISSIIAFISVGGTTGIRAELNVQHWYNAFERGIANDLAAIFAVLIGFLSTQTYLQAIFMGRDAQTSSKGTIISGMMMLPLGLMGTTIGLYMRSNYDLVNSSQALPIFVVDNFPPLLSGVVLGILLIMVIVTGAGLTLGVSTMFSRDIYGQLINKNADEQKKILVTRMMIILIVVLSLLFVVTNLNSVIMEWSYISMILRGTAMFLPLCAAVFYKNKIDHRAGVLAIIVAPIIAMLWAVVVPTGINPLYIGLGLGGLILLSGFKSNNNLLYCLLLKKSSDKSDNFI